MKITLQFHCFHFIYFYNVFVRRSPIDDIKIPESSFHFKCPIKCREMTKWEYKLFASFVRSFVCSNPSKRTNSHELFGIIMVLYIDRRGVNMIVGEGGVLANKPPIIGNSVKWNLWFRLISLNWFALVGSADRTISRRMIGNSRRFWPVWVALQGYFQYF